MLARISLGVYSLFLVSMWVVSCNHGLTSRGSYDKKQQELEKTMLIVVGVPRCNYMKNILIGWRAHQPEYSDRNNEDEDVCLDN